MNDRMPEPVSLVTIARGEVVAKFEQALAQVIENIRDPDTAAEAVREIVIKARLKPTGDQRSMVLAEVGVALKLAPPKGVNTALYLDPRGRAVAYEQNPEQVELFGPRPYLTPEQGE